MSTHWSPPSPTSAPESSAASRTTSAIADHCRKFRESLPPCPCSVARRSLPSGRGGGERFESADTTPTECEEPGSRLASQERKFRELLPPVPQEYSSPTAAGPLVPVRVFSPCRAGFPTGEFEPSPQAT